VMETKLLRLTDEEIGEVMAISRDLRDMSFTDDPRTARLHYGIYAACERTALGREHDRSRIARVPPQRTGVRRG
jgi:hypothetical protein